jgi:predicted Fe-S protein YdhL (DUF1289 family)
MRRNIKERKPPITPCIRVCKLENGICIGCKRTEKELSDWFWMTDKQKLQIMESLKER